MAHVIGLAAAMASVAAIAACGAGNRQQVEPRPRIRIAHTTIPNFADIPAVLTTRALAADGYDVETTAFAHASLAAEALARGSMDVGFGGLSTYWAAAARGAPIVTVAEQARGVHVLVAAQPLRTCAALAGKRLGLNNLGATGSTLVETYVAEVCPGTEPQMLVMPGTNTRAAAFASGGLDAAVLMREDYIDLALRMPERIGLVEDLGTRWTLAAAGIMVNAGFAKARPQIVQDLVGHYVSAIGAVVDDPARLAAEATGILGDARDWRPVAQAFIEANTWPVDGGLEAGVVRDTIAFHVRAGSLPGDVDAARLIDRSYLDRTLDGGGASPPSPSP
jgi:ABC-type nitrate/sulfonate/bicarbonate transport system substrate-binding protein